jgi:hypothetical protein
MRPKTKNTRKSQNKIQLSKKHKTNKTLNPAKQNGELERVARGRGEERSSNSKVNPLLGSPSQFLLCGWWIVRQWLKYSMLMQTSDSQNTEVSKMITIGGAQEIDTRYSTERRKREGYWNTSPVCFPQQSSIVQKIGANNIFQSQRHTFAQKLINLQTHKQTNNKQTKHLVVRCQTPNFQNFQVFFQAWVQCQFQTDTFVQILSNRQEKDV